MAENSKIEWTDATWNPVTGCAVVSPGCTNCYAMKLAGTRLQHHPSRAGLVKESKAGPVWTGEVRLNEEWLDQPLRWKRPRRIFVCAHGDLFADGVPDAWIDRVFAVMAQSPQHVFQVLTKRAERMREYVAGFRPAHDEYARVLAGELHWKRAEAHGPPKPIFVTKHGKPYFGLPEAGDMFFRAERWPLPNVWLGVSVEDQRRANERIPHLLATPAAVRFVSAEPLLGPVRFTRLSRSIAAGLSSVTNAMTGHEWDNSEIFGENLPEADDRPTLPRLDWVIVGGESGPGARPFNPDWARSVRDQCKAAGTAFFMKQMGGPRKPFPPIPDDLDIKEFPK